MEILEFFSGGGCNDELDSTKYLASRAQERVYLVSHT